MAEDQTPTPPAGAGQPNSGQPAAGQGEPPRLLIQTQYVKDLSFENPRAPQSLDPGSQVRPQIQVRVDVRTQPMPEQRHEVALHVHIEAKAGEDTSFVLELIYGGVFALLNIPDEARQALLLIECPRLLFPFARRIVADATRDGGFPPLMIDPIDFTQLYRRRQQELQAAQQAQARPQASAVAAGEGQPN